MSDTAERRTCSVDRCGRRIHGHTLCSMHYHRWRAHGDPLALKTLPDGAQAEFIESVVAMEPTGECVLWPYHINQEGYGKTTVAGTSNSAHREVLRSAVGDPPPEKPLALHAPADVCGNRSCVAPWHLRWGTVQDNSDDRTNDGNVPRGEQHTQSKLTVEQVRRIKADTRISRLIASDYDVDPSTIQRVKSGKSWGWLDS